MGSLFSHYPKRPKSAECLSAYVILCYAHDAASSFIDIFDKIRKSRSARGTPTDEEQDLLRAALIFSAAGLDSMVKQLVRDALPKVITTNDGAHAMLASFGSRRLKKRGEIDIDLLANLIVSDSPKTSLIEELIEDLTGSSLQNAEQLLRVASFFNIESNAISKDIPKLQEVFGRRNAIAHEMDVDFTQKNRNRFPRAKKPMRTATNLIFEVAEAFLKEVDRKLSASVA